jgi:hypothetical protein
VDRGFTFKVGKNKGLYELVRLNQNNSNVATRLYAYGSDKNLPADYRNYSPRLMFPAGVDACLPHDVLYTVTPIGGGMQTITFTWGFAPIGLNIGIIYKPSTGSLGWVYDWGLTTPPRTITVPVGNYDVRFRALGGICGIVASPIFQVTGTITTPIFPYTPFPFLEQNVGLYGVIEHTEIFEDVYPHRTGKVTSIDAGNIHRFFDTAMDFDINAQLLPGLTAKVTFNTGQLAGYTFEIATYNHGSKEFVINQNLDERVLDIPNSTIKPGIGDTYVITDIAMPTIYITKAENELLAKAQEFLNTKSVPQVLYQLVVDPVHIRDNKIPIQLGDEIWLEDVEMSIQQKIRITAITRNIIEENEYQIEIANAVIKPRIVNAETAIRSVDRRIIDIAQRVTRLRDLIPP